MAGMSKLGGHGVSGWLGPRAEDALVERQIRLWNLEQRARRSSPRVSSHWPIITISREFGALGAYVGEQLAARLGFSFWDSRVIETLARMAHCSDNDVAPVDERSLGRIEEFLSLLLRFTEVPTAEYREALRLLVRTLEQHGSAVIVGRGASFLVDPTQALRLRLTAPLEYRVETYAAREGVNNEEARRIVSQRDRERRSYLAHVMHANPDDALNYDMVLNVAGIPVERMVDMLVSTYRAKFGRVPSVAERGPRVDGPAPSVRI